MSWPTTGWALAAWVQGESYGDVVVIFRIFAKTSPQEQERAYALAKRRKGEAEAIMKRQEAWVKDFHPLPSIDLDLPRKLQDREYRERFFLAEVSAEIARQLIELRKRRGYSQAELAERAGTHQPAVSRAEQADYHNWSFNTLRKLTNAMEGRLRVVIDAWEDVLSEYLPDGHDAIIAREPDEEQNLTSADRRTRQNSAASSGNPRRDLGAAGVEEKGLNAENPISASRRSGDKRLTDQGHSQWS
jgi:transcriptional regulator with XRE-family HTH domain